MFCNLPLIKSVSAGSSGYLGSFCACQAFDRKSNLACGATDRQHFRLPSSSATRIGGGPGGGQAVRTADEVGLSAIMKDKADSTWMAGVFPLFKNSTMRDGSDSIWSRRLDWGPSQALWSALKALAL